jgi:hypothetical protein
MLFLDISTKENVMSRKRFYYYEFSDGYAKWLTNEEAHDYAGENSVEIVRDGYVRNVKSIKRVRDGFQSGFQHQLGKHIGGRREYDRELKKAGLVEVGNEKVNTPDKSVKYWTDDVCKDVKKETGVTDSTLKALQDTE